MFAIQESCAGILETDSETVLNLLDSSGAVKIIKTSPNSRFFMLEDEEQLWTVIAATRNKEDPVHISVSGPISICMALDTSTVIGETTFLLYLAALKLTVFNPKNKDHIMKFREALKRLRQYHNQPQEFDQHMACQFTPKHGIRKKTTVLGALGDILDNYNTYYEV